MIARSTNRSSPGAYRIWGGSGLVVERPGRAFELAAPAALGSKFEGVDLETYEPDVLLGVARVKASKGDYATARLMQYWAVKNSGESSGMYDLACYCSREGKVDEAIYWLQEACEREGVSVDWSEQDPDLEAVRDDRRWSALLAFLREYERYWQSSGISQVKLIAPTDYDGRQPIPVCIYLHGMGGDPGGLINDQMQDYADELHMAFVGVSGTRPLGPASFNWSEDPTKDFQHIDRALSGLKDRLAIREGQAILIGFSQGAAMSVEIAARHPERFAGAIAFSPGGLAVCKTGDLPAKPVNAKQGFVLICGAQEHPGTVTTTETYAEHMHGLGARVELKEYPDMAIHALPEDFAERLPEWVEFAMRSR